MKAFLSKLESDIILVDIGCSDELQGKWKPLESNLTYIGFEPNKTECQRISEVPNGYRSSLFLPYAVAGFTGTSTLNVTESYYCTSLLKPNVQWLSRFEFRDYFKIKDVEEISVTSLDEIEDLKGMDIDIIKCDSQGLELEILKSAKDSLKTAIYVETESGFHENYINESTQAEVDVFMRKSGFVLFGILERRMPLHNKFKDYARSSAQVLWCECKWMRDLITVDQNDEFEKLQIDRNKALKYLLIFAVNGAYDYGLEYAKIFHRRQLLTDEEFVSLSDIDNWRFESSISDVNKTPEVKRLSPIKSLLIKIFQKNLQISKMAIRYFSN